MVNEDHMRRTSSPRDDSPRECQGVQPMRLCSSTEKTGRWTDEEHTRFLHGLELFGKKWTKVADIVGTRTTVQVRSHAQKYFQKLEKDRVALPHNSGEPSSSSSHNHLTIVTTVTSQLKVAGVQPMSDPFSPSLSRARRQEHDGRMMSRVCRVIESGRERVVAACPQNNGPNDSNRHLAVPVALRRFLPPTVVSGGRVGAVELAAGLFRLLSPLVLPETSAPAASRPAVLANNHSIHVASPVSIRGVATDDVESCRNDAEEAARRIFDEVDYDVADLTSPLVHNDHHDISDAASAIIPDWYQRGGTLSELLEGAELLDWCDDDGGQALSDSRDRCATHQPRTAEMSPDDFSEVVGEDALPGQIIVSRSELSRRHDEACPEPHQEQFCEVSSDLAWTRSHVALSRLPVMHRNVADTRPEDLELVSRKAGIDDEYRGDAMLPRYSSFDALCTASLMIGASDSPHTTRKRALSQGSDSLPFDDGLFYDEPLDFDDPTASS